MRAVDLHVEVFDLYERMLVHAACQTLFLDCLDAIICEMITTARIMIVRISAEAYARPCTSGMGLLSWKKMARGNVAAGSSRYMGMLSLKPAVKSTEATSPMPRPKARSTAV